MIQKNRIKISEEEATELGRLQFLSIRYENMLKQAVKYNMANLEKAALFINATLDYEFYKEKLIDKYPILRNAKVFYFNCDDEYIFFE